VQDVGPADAAAAGLHEIRGVLIEGLSSPNSPAAKAGILPGDVLMSVNNRQIDRVSDLQRLVFGYKPGQTVSVDVMRFGSKKTLQLTLGEPPAATTLASASSGEESGGGIASRRLRVTVAPVTPEVAAQFGMANGTQGVAVVRVDPSGPAFGVLLPGDLITAAIGAGGKRPIRTADDLQQAVAHAVNGVVSLSVTTTPPNGGVPVTRVANVQLSGGM
jgi:serine protease Do